MPISFFNPRFKHLCASLVSPFHRGESEALLKICFEGVPGTWRTSRPIFVRPLFFVRATGLLEAAVLCAIPILFPHLFLRTVYHRHAHHVTDLRPSTDTISRRNILRPVYVSCSTFVKTVDGCLRGGWFSMTSITLVSGVYPVYDPNRFRLYHDVVLP